MSKFYEQFCAPPSLGLNPKSLSAEELARQADWSARTFGPATVRGPLGPLDHLEKEIEEVRRAHKHRRRCRTASAEVKQRAHANELEEWADLLILVFDGAMRSGFSPVQIFRAYRSKLTVNRQREWPDWRTAAPDKAIEHVR